MTELVNDPFYQFLEDEYPDLELDYVILSVKEPYSGASSHQNAVCEALFPILSKRLRDDDEDEPFTLIPSKMQSSSCTPDELFEECLEEGRMNYWYAFSSQPNGVTYDKKDFKRVNDKLFPKSNRDELEVFSWNNDFSDYFDDGKEWWGTGLWSIYDPALNRFVIIGASLTD